MDTAAHLQKLQTYMRKHDGLPSMSALPFVFNLSSQETEAAINFLVDSKHLALKSNGEIEPGIKFALGMAKLSSTAVPAGYPIDVAEESPAQLNMHSYLVPSESRTIIIPIAGNSMVDAGINDGDMAVVDTEMEANPGDIVVAEIDGKYTLKRLILGEDGTFHLKAENPAFPSMTPQVSLNIHGVLIGLARRY